MGTDGKVGEAAAAELGAGFDGDLITPGDGAYDEARTIFNAMIDRRPAVIAQCASENDVVRALAVARDAELEVAVRSGGHSVAGASLCDDGLVVDMRRMSSVTVDPEARTATVAGGATWGHFDRATQEHNLATTGGRVSTTGVAGLTLGGGSGWLERKFGLACDSLQSVRLVTAAGDLVTASETENEELFWALHGGGGNFGIATELVFRLHPLPATTLALLLWPAERGPELATRYRDLVEDGAPYELGGGFGYLTGPPEEFIPAHLQGRLCAAVIGVYAGSEQQLREALAPILELEHEGGLIAEMPYAELQCAIDDPPGHRNYWSVEHLTGFPDAAIDLFCRRAQDIVIPSPTQHVVFPWGGAVASGGDSWPLPHRSATWAVHPFGLWEDPADDERMIAYARAACADMKPFATGAVYLNFVGDEGEDRVVAGYGRDNYDRLAAVKAEYDPDNVFHLHHSIKPRAAAAA